MSVTESKTGGKRNGLRISLVGGQSEARSEIRRALATLGEPPLEVQEAEPRNRAAPQPAEGPPVDVAMVMFNGDQEASLDYLQYQSTQTPHPVLFALLDERSPVSMRRAIRAGADELLFLPLDPYEVTRALLKISEARLRAERRQSGVVCALTSVVGGVGVSSLAANLALALRYTLNKRVGLVDLDLQAGALAVMLNVEPEVSIMPLARLEKKLDSIQLESALSKHSSGVYLLAAPKRVEEGELVSDLTVGGVLDVMREMFDFVVVDCGRHIDENAVAAWERCEHLFYVLSQAVVSARCAWRFIDLFERLGLTTVEPQYVLNRYVANQAIGQKQLEATLGRAIFARIPRDDKAMERVEVSGRDLWQVGAGSVLAKSLEEFARRLFANTAAAAEVEGGLFARLFSAMAARS